MNKDLKNAFIIHLCKYLGVGLVSGSIVHAGTLGGNSFNYIALVAAGTCLTVFGNYLEYAVKNIAIGLRFLVLAIGLSFGTGMLSGGIQHFADSPSYGAILLSLGAIITFISMAYKDFADHINIKTVAVAVVASVALYFALSVAGANLFGGQNAGHDAHQTEGHVH